MNIHPRGDRAVSRGPAPVRRSARTPVLTPARARVLELVQQREAATVEDVAHALQQHPNTVREHLDALVRDGLLLRASVAGPGRGRPAWLYRPDPERSEPDPRLREHTALVVALASCLTERSDDPRSDARAAGERWGRAMVGTRPDVAAAPDPSDAAPAVLGLLDDLEFGPRQDDAGRVVLTSCPFLDAARSTSDVVCAMHEGMVAGALEALGSGADVADGVRLAPFGAPDGCLLSLPVGTRRRRTPPARTHAGSARGTASAR